MVYLHEETGWKFPRPSFILLFKYRVYFTNMGHIIPLIYIIIFRCFFVMFKTLKCYITILHRIKPPELQDFKDFKWFIIGKGIFSLRKLSPGTKKVHVSNFYSNLLYFSREVCWKKRKMGREVLPKYLDKWLLEGKDLLSRVGGEVLSRKHKQ